MLLVTVLTFFQNDYHTCQVQTSERHGGFVLTGMTPDIQQLCLIPDSRLHLGCTRAWTTDDEGRSSWNLLEGRALARPVVSATTCLRATHRQAKRGPPFRP